MASANSCAIYTMLSEYNIIQEETISMGKKNDLVSGCQFYLLDFIFCFKIIISLNMETNEMSTKMDTF